MRISTKGRYGVRIMLELALHYNRELMTVRSIAKRQNISDKYIEQIISTLHKAELVKSQRGSSGGYRLAKPPSAITVGQILRATEGGLQLVDCTGPSGEACPRMDECVTTEIWSDIQIAIEAVVDSITLEKLVNRHNEKCHYSYII